MSKIRSIQLNNFKFFKESNPIILDGRHLLLYGENGSGKSSLSYALYTLLEAATKHPEDVQKYFELPSVNDSSLVNIWRNEEPSDAFLEITDDLGCSYRLSYNDTSICGNSSLLESQRASDFLSYKSLFQFQLFKNSEECDLKDIFEYSVLPYVSFSKYTYLGKEYANAMDIHNLYLAQPPKRPKSRAIVYKNSKEYKNYLGLESHFNNSMTELVEYINYNYHQVIEALGYNFKIHVQYIPAYHHKRDTCVDITDFHIMLTLTEYEGKALDIKHPNTFLNEAKMAALAFAVRWAILDYRINQEVAPNALKFLVLDDLMISLDMGNRNKLIKYIINNLSDKFQIIFLTHNRRVFDYMLNQLIIKYKINNCNREFLEQGWQLMEMYDVIKDGGHEPLLQSYNSPIVKAWRYFNGVDGVVDYNACGNALRQSIEQEFIRIFKAINLSFDENKLLEEKSHMIAACMEIARINFPNVGFGVDIIDELESLRVFTLNPTSHYNPEMNFYRVELKDAFDIYMRLTQMEAYCVVPCDEILEFEINCKKSGKRVYQIKILNDILVTRANMMAESKLINNMMSINLSKIKERTKDWHRVNQNFAELYKSTIEYLNQTDIVLDIPITDANYTERLMYQGKTIKELCQNMYQPH